MQRRYMEFLALISFWHWFLLATFLITIEAMAPFAYFLWLGVAAIIQGILLYFIPMEWITQFLIYGCVSVVITMLGRRFVPFHQLDPHEENINRTFDRLIGKILILSEPIQEGKAQVKVGDSVWLVKGPDLPVGTKVKVVDIDNNRLVVESLDN